MSKRSADEAKLERFDAVRIRHSTEFAKRTAMVDYCRSFSHNPAMIADMMVQMLGVVSYRTTFEWIQEYNNEMFIGFVKAGCLLISWDRSTWEPLVSNTSLKHVLKYQIERSIADLGTASSRINEWVDVVFGAESPFSANSLAAGEIDLSRTDPMIRRISTLSYNYYLYAVRRIVNKPWMTDFRSDSCPGGLKINTSQLDGGNGIKIVCRLSWLKALIQIEDGASDVVAAADIICKIFDACNGSTGLEKIVIGYCHNVIEMTNSKESEGKFSLFIETLLKNGGLSLRRTFGDFLVQEQPAIVIIPKYIYSWFNPDTIMTFIKYIPFENLSIHLIPEIKRRYPGLNEKVALQFALKNFAEGDNNEPVIEEKLKPMIRSVLELGLPEIAVQEVLLGQFNLVNEYMKEAYEQRLYDLTKEVEAEPSVGLVRRVSNMSIRRQ